MNAIAAVDKNLGIGLRGSLLFRLPGDMAHFKKMTLGKTVIMGRNTLLSLPGARPLPGRDNIVLSSNPAFRAEGVRVVHSLEELFETVRPLNGDSLFVAGGARIYSSLLPYCKNAYLTRVDACFEADSFFPDLFSMPSWRPADESGPFEQCGVRYFFTRYENSKVLSTPAR